MTKTAVERAELTTQQRAAKLRAENNGGVHPGGRPTSYKPEFCDQVIEMGKIGASKAEMALELDISWSSFVLWEQTNEEFSNAVKRAMQLSRGWWEKQGRLKTFDDKDFNPTSYIFQMKNRFRDEWADRQVNEQTGNVTITWGKAE